MKAHSGRWRWASIGRGLFPALISIMALIVAGGDVAAQSQNGPSPATGAQDPILQLSSRDKVPGPRLLKLSPIRPQDADAVLHAHPHDPNLIIPPNSRGDLHLTAPVTDSNPASGQ